MDATHVPERYGEAYSGGGYEVWADCECGKRCHGYGQNLATARMLLRRDIGEHQRGRRARRSA